MGVGTAAGTPPTTGGVATEPGVLVCSRGLMRAGESGMESVIPGSSPSAWRGGGLEINRGGEESREEGSAAAAADDDGVLVEARGGGSRTGVIVRGGGRGALDGVTEESANGDASVWVTSSVLGWRMFMNSERLSSEGLTFSKFARERTVEVSSAEISSLMRLSGPSVWVMVGV